MIRSVLTAGLVAGAMVLSAGAANAVQIVGTSSGAFSNLSSCDNSGSSQDCALFNSNTQLRWGSTNSSNFTNPSTLTANNVAINTNTNATGVVIGSLTWFNSSTPDNRTPDDLAVDWTLSVSFTQPNVNSDSNNFDLDIFNTNNPQGDYINGFQLSELNGLVFSLTGVLVSNLRYDVVDGPGNNGVGDTGITSSTYWYNQEGNTATLRILADFTHTQTQVPEPATLGLLGLGIAGLAFARRRRVQA